MGKDFDSEFQQAGSNRRSGMFRCGVCGGEMKFSDKKCPHCGNGNPHYRGSGRFSFGKIFIILFGVIFLGTIVVFVLNAISLKNFQETFNNNQQIETADQQQIESVEVASVSLNETGDTLDICFVFYDNDRKSSKPDATFDLEIRNDKSGTVYQNTTTVNEQNYITTGENFLGVIHIPVSEIASSTIDSGTLIYSVVCADGFKVQHLTFDIDSGLPLAPVNISGIDLPVEVGQYDSHFGYSSKVTIESVSGQWDETFDNMMNVTIAGTVNSVLSGTCVFNYQILDEEGSTIKSNFIMLSAMSEGDKFKQEITLSDVDISKAYSIRFSNFGN